VIVLDRTGVDDTCHIVALFGTGLIGRSILTALAIKARFRQRRLQFSWQEPGRRRREAVEIEQYIANLAGAVRGNITECSVNIVWAAGLAGFASSRADTEAELEGFRDVLGIAERLSERFPQARHAFHLTSSAGGLFEGQRLVSLQSIPRPRRPYGELKLAQERLLESSPAPMARLVYRPSSVYGFLGEGIRLGLVGVLARNAIRHQVSRIFGAPDSLRDYVLAADIGRFIAGQLTRTTSNTEVFLLASGRPSAMFEMLQRVERAVGRRLYVQFDSQPCWTEHNSYRSSALPAGWRVTALDTGIRQTATRLKEAFAVTNAA
jgi:nucleoside-diphosphate-sugar epimerase